ncbi:MAG: class D sortase [Bacilli bacterium]
MKNKRKKNNVITIILDTIIILAIVATFSFGYKYSLEVYSAEYSTSQKLSEVDELIKNDISREDMENTPNYGIYKLKVKNVTDWMPVIEGDNLEFLGAGIGHHSSTGHPGDSRQIFLSAHRDTHFKSLEYVDIGDVVIIQTSYGKFEYVVDKTKIVDYRDVSVIKTDKLAEDELVLMTCWPFNSYVDSEERYLIYAYPKK